MNVNKDTEKNDKGEIKKRNGADERNTRELVHGREQDMERGKRKIEEKEGRLVEITQFGKKWKGYLS